jgi:hypothetical protein
MPMVAAIREETIALDRAGFSFIEYADLLA